MANYQHNTPFPLFIIVLNISCYRPDIGRAWIWFWRALIATSAAGRRLVISLQNTKKKVEILFHCQELLVEPELGSRHWPWLSSGSFPPKNHPSSLPSYQHSIQISLYLEAPSIDASCLPSESASTLVPSHLFHPQDCWVCRRKHQHWWGLYWNHLITPNHNLYDHTGEHHWS